MISIQEILDSFIFDDQVYALPYDFGPYIMYYNKDLFDNMELNIRMKIQPGKNLKIKCKQLTQDGNYGNSICFPVWIIMILRFCHWEEKLLNEKGEFDITGDKTTASVNSLWQI